MKRRLSHRARDRWAVFFGVLLLAAMVLLIPLAIWLQVFAPCQYVDWMPVKDVPARCL